MPSPKPASVGETASAFLSGNSTNTAVYQQELHRFVRWCGRDRPIGELTPRDVEAYAERSGADSIKKLEPVKAFFIYAQKEGLTASNLGAHLRVRRGVSRPGRRGRARADVPVRLTKAGYERVQGELEGLKGQRVEVAGDLQRAMADKDFRENAPLDAAREEQGHLEARIRELEQTLRRSEIVTEEDGERAAEPLKRSRLGSRVVARDLEDDQELAYVLVDPREVDLVQGKISIESPVGKAFLNRSPGEVVEVKAPVGAIRYRIERVER